MSDVLTADQVLDAAPDAIVVVDVDANVVRVNGQAEKLFLYDRAELLGKPLDVLVPDRARPRHQEMVASYFAEPTTRAMGSAIQLVGRRRDGSEVPVEVSLSPIHTSGGILVCAAIRDVTERKAIERAAKLNADRLMSAIESIEDAFAIYDADERLVLCNSSYRTIVAQDLEGPLVGRPFAKVLDDWLPSLAFTNEAERMQFRSDRLNARGAQRDTSDVRTCDDRRLRVTGKATLEGGMVQTVWDLTDDLRREEELQRTRVAAEQASNAKSEFLSAMSHELRTPLNAILGFAQLLFRDRKQPLAERHLERVGHILKGGEHLQQLIDEILDLARIEAGRVPISLEPVSVSEVVREAYASLEAMAQRAEVEFRVAPLPPALPRVVADRVRFKQVLLNFGTNAIKYGRAGGHATIQVEALEDVVRISVADDGVGVAPEKQARIFEPFYRAGQETGAIEGTGIGLAITKRLAELMDGRVGFTSAPTRGSTFWIELPAHTPTEAPSATVAPEKITGRLSDAHGAPQVVLYVEDNPANIAFMEDLLGEFPTVHLLTAPTAEIGIEMARARKPDVVIMDINLPGMSGLEATRRLKAWEETRTIPVIALSAAATDRDIKRSESVGFYRYLTKPVEVDKLIGVLEELLQE